MLCQFLRYFHIHYVKWSNDGMTKMASCFHKTGNIIKSGSESSLLCPLPTFCCLICFLLELLYMVFPLIQFFFPLPPKSESSLINPCSMSSLCLDYTSPTLFWLSNSIIKIYFKYFFCQGPRSMYKKKLCFYIPAMNNLKRKLRKQFHCT